MAVKLNNKQALRLFTLFTMTGLLAACSDNQGKYEASNPGKKLVMDSIATHGGINKWRSNGLLQFRWEYKMSDLGRVVNSKQIVDPITMSAKHTVPDKSITFGHYNGEYWKHPSDAKFIPPPKFWTLTPYYFVGIPFVFADDQINYSLLDQTKTFEGKEYSQVKLTYASSAGDSPDDYYVLLIDPETKVTRGAYYIVTNPIVYKGGALLEKFITLDDLTDYKGVLIPKSHKTYRMTNGIIGEPMRSTVVSEIEFLPQNSVNFSIPEGAIKL